MSIDAVPVWVIFAGTVLIVILAIEAGYRLGGIAHRRSEDEKESPVSAIAATVLGLVAFMLAFTFGIVANRFDARKELVREDANAIRTAWQRSDFLPEPDRAEAKELIREYLSARAVWAQSRDSGSTRVKEILAEQQRIQNRLWETAVANARKDMNSDVAALYIESLNEVFAIHALRVAVGLQARLPLGIWVTLTGITILGMMGVGYQTGIAGSKRSMARPILAVSFAMVIVLIVALDRPVAGIVTVSQQPLIDLLSAITSGTVE